jgi:tetratricopeptide (TPR) repeat protein
MKADSGAKMALQEDGSVFVHQRPPARNDTYALVFPYALKGVTLLRLEALADPRLPDGGPGWGFNGNFHLHELTLQAAPAGSPDKARAITFRGAWADFSEVSGYTGNTDVRGAVDGKDNTCWSISPEFNKDHAAVFELAERLGDGRPSRLTVRLRHLGSFRDHNLGRFRLSFTDDAATAQATRLRWELKDAEVVDCLTGLGKAHAQQGRTQEAVASFTEALRRTPDRTGKARLLAAAAPLKGVLAGLAERAAADGKLQAALARHYGDEGNAPLAAAARTRARALLARQLAAEPDSAAAAADLADLLGDSIPPADHFWIDDEPPFGANQHGNTPWEFVSGPAHPVFRGKKSTRRQAAGFSQHFFDGAAPGLKLGEGARLFAYVYLDPQDPPKTVMLQFWNGSWEHRAFWGEDLISFGTLGTASRLPMGPLPKAGQWVRLEVEAGKVGLDAGSVLSGWAFTQHGGTCYWDAAGTTRLGGFETPWESLAAAYHRLGEKEALGDLLKRHPAAAAGVGDLYAAAGDWPRALAEYRKALGARPADTALLTRLAAACGAAGRTREAVPYLAALSAANPEDVILLLKVAALQAWFGEEKEFAATRRHVLTFGERPDDPSASSGFARAYSILPSTDKAELEAVLRHARKVAKVVGDGVGREWAQMDLGMAEYRSGNYAAADKALLAAAQAVTNPDYVAWVKGTAAFYRAMSLFRQGKKDEARKVATEAAATMKPLPADKQNPLAGGANHDDLILWLAYKEAKALLDFDRAPPPKGKERKQ